MSVDVGTDIAGYRLVRLIGEGGMSRVFLAERGGGGGAVVLKVLREELAQDDDFRRRFLREWGYLASLDHPNVIRVHDAGEAGGLLYLAMDYVEGTDLYALLEEQAPIEPERAIRLLSQVAAALDAAHEAGILHRDVKPGNVLVAGDGGGPAPRCYLTDFGLSKHTTKDSVSLTAAGTFVGTLAYTAPEEILGGKLDRRADVYSLACVLFECLAGERPFAGKSEVEVMQAHIESPPPKLSKKRSGLPAALNDVFARGLAKDPGDRYGSCRELVEVAAAAIGVPDAARVPEPLATGPLRLEVLGGNAAGSEIHVDGTVMIGRQQGGEGNLADDLELSRQHATIAREPGGGLTITDLGSTNGTFVNDRRITAPQALSPGDRIEMGTTTLVVLVSPVTAAEPAPLVLLLEVDLEAGEGRLELEGSPDSLGLVADGGRWRVTS